MTIRPLPIWAKRGLRFGLGLALVAGLTGCGGPAAPAARTGPMQSEVLPRVPDYRPTLAFRLPPEVMSPFHFERLAFSPDGAEVAVSDSRGKVVRIFTPDGKYLRDLGATAPWFARLEGPMGVCYTPDSRRIVVSDVMSHHVLVFERSGAFVRLLGDPKDERGDPRIRDPWDVACSPDGASLVLNNGLAYDADGRPNRILPAGGSAVSFGPDGTSVFAGAPGANRVLVVDPQNQRVRSFGTDMTPALTQVPGLLHHPMGVAVSPDGQMVAVTDEYQARLLVYDAKGAHLWSWDGKAGENKKTNQTNPRFDPDDLSAFSYPRGVAFSPDGTRLAIVDTSRNRVLVFTTDQPLKPVRPPANPSPTAAK